LTTVGVAIVLAGCKDDSTMTPEQENAIRHPKAASDWKGPDPAAQEKMGQSIDAYRQKHANDKVEFKSGS